MFGLDKKVIRAVSNARNFFEIEDFPGNFFNFVQNKNLSDEKGFLLFKEDIGKLSGFIGYGPNELIVICVNYKRPIGHQNFTFAHEIGHLFLHNGQNISDDNSSIYSKDVIEQEANDFASELLYPENLFKEDFELIVRNGFFSKTRRKDLAICIDALCHKYYLSFEAILRRLLYKNREASKYNEIKNEIDSNLGCKISEYFDKDFYVPNDKLAEYQQLRKPYEELKRKIDELVLNNKIGVATSESIKLRCGIDLESSKL